MVALEILLNGKPFCTAGADDFSSLTACLLVVGKLGDHTPLQGDFAKLKSPIKPELLISGQLATSIVGGDEAPKYLSGMQLKFDW